MYVIRNKAIGRMYKRNRCFDGLYFTAGSRPEIVILISMTQANNYDSEGKLTWTIFYVTELPVVLECSHTQEVSKEVKIA